VSRPDVASAPPPVTVRAAPGRRRPTTLSKRRQYTAAYLLITPFFLFFIAMLIVPLGFAGYLSLFQSRLIGGVTFVGLDNYAKALVDPNFQAGLLRVMAFLVVQVPVMLGFALFFALALDSGRVRGGRALRLLIFVPYAIPGVVATLMWGYLYGPDFGPIAQISRAIGLGAPNLLSQGSVLGSIMNIVTWEYIGYNMIVMYSALRSVPSELYEAAEIDGAGEIRIAWSIKMPAIRPAILLTVIFSTIGSFQLFNEPSLLRNIAPDAIGSSFTPNYYAYNLAFVNQDLNYAAAIAFALGLVTMVVSYVVQLSTRARGRAIA
jgi:multiple sugar transport system permease protein